MASRKPDRGSSSANLVGKQIIVKYAEGDFHGKVSRKVSPNKFIVTWEGDTDEDPSPIFLDPKKMGKHFKADENGWELVEGMLWFILYHTNLG